MSECLPKSYKNEEILFPSENSESQGEIDNLRQNLTETDLSHFFKIDLFKMIKIKKFAHNKNKIITEDYFKDHEQINEVKYNMFMILFNDCEYNEEYSGAINKDNNSFILKRLVIQKYNIAGGKLIPGQKYYSFIPYRRESQDIIFPYNNEVIKILIKKNVKIMINGKAVDGLTEKEFLSKNKIILPELERTKKEKHLKSKSDKNSNQKKNKKPYNFLQQIEQNKIGNVESNQTKKENLFSKNFPTSSSYHFQNIIIAEKSSYADEKNM